MNNKKITADMILKLLLEKHTKDICVPECKSGSSWFDKAVKRFDLFAMKRSYSKPMTWIYEIKVARSDFLQDDKWQGYLKYCTDFYFVAPYGIINVDEVPEQAGLLLSTQNGTRLHCKKKAPHREQLIPDGVFKYIFITKSEYWSNWLKLKEEDHKLGYEVSRRIRQLYEKNVEMVTIRQNSIDAKLKKFESVKKIIEDIGFNPDHLRYDYKDRMRERIEEINTGFPEKNVVEHLNCAIQDLKKTIDVIQKFVPNKEPRKT